MELTKWGLFAFHIGQIRSRSQPGKTTIASWAKPQEDLGQNHESSLGKTTMGEAAFLSNKQVPWPSSRDSALRGSCRHESTGTTIMWFPLGTPPCCFVMGSTPSGLVIRLQNPMSKDLFATANLQNELPAAKSSWGKKPICVNKSERFVAPLQEQTYRKIQMVLQHRHCQCQQ